MSNLVLVRFLQDDTPYKRGSTHAVSEAHAAKFMRQGVAEVADVANGAGVGPAVSMYEAAPELASTDEDEAP